MDVGKNSTKAMYKRFSDGLAVPSGNKPVSKKIQLLTRGEVIDDDVQLGRGSYITKVGKLKYLIGKQSSKRSRNSSKINELHKMAGLTAITECISPDTPTDVYMILAAPLQQLEKVSKEKYRDLFLNKGKEIEVVVNDLSYKLTFKSVLIKAEGSGTIFKDEPNYYDRVVLLVDIGGVNLGFAIYDDAGIDSKNRDILEFGNDKLEEYISTAITEFYKTGELATQLEIDRAIQEGALFNMNKEIPDSKEAISSAKTRFIDDMFSEIEEKKIPYSKVQEIVFTGGTTQNLITEIKNKFPNFATIVESPQWASVEGLYEGALEKYENEVL